MSDSHGGRFVMLEHGPDGLRGKEFGKSATPEYWDQLWASNAHTYGPALSGHLPHQLRATIGSTLSPPASVLEAGCGLGHFTVAMHARGFDAVGLDWAERTVEGLQERFTGPKFVQGDVRSSPFPDDYFDAVYSPGVCEHFEEGPDAVLADALRVLKPGGLLFVSTPHLNALRRRRWRADTQSGDFYQYLFSIGGMTRTLKRLGFDVEASAPYGVWATLRLEWPTLSKVRIGKAAGVLDAIPGVRQLGSTCIWTARKPGST